MSTADERFLAACADEGDGNISAGWRPWMGPRPEPTPDERAAADAAIEAAKARFRAAALAEGDGTAAPQPADRPADDALTAGQRRLADARPGQPVHLTDPATNRRFVLLPADEYDRLVKAAG